MAQIAPTCCSAHETADGVLLGSAAWLITARRA